MTGSSDIEQSVADRAKALIHDAAKAISWTLPQPSSANTQMGFGIRSGRLRHELERYVHLYLERWGDLPDIYHALAAGGCIRHRIETGHGGRFGFPYKTVPLITTEASFEEIFANACRATDGLSPHARTDPTHFPSAARPAAALWRAATVRLSTADQPCIEVGLYHRSVREFDDLLSYFGNATIVLIRAIGLLWAHTAFRALGPYTPGGDWPTTPAQAWERVRKRNERLQQEEPQ